MTDTDLDESTTLVRSMDVGTRLAAHTPELADEPSGSLLLETMLGRYVFDADARKVWALVDGARTVADIAAEIAATDGVDAQQSGVAMQGFCTQLLDLGLARRV